MPQFFERKTADGSHTVTAYTRNDFHDGRLMIEPPVQANDDFWRFIGSEYGVDFTERFENAAATIIGFTTNGESAEFSVHDLEPRYLLMGTVSDLIEELEQLGNKDKFLEVEKQRPEEVGIL